MSRVTTVTDGLFPPYVAPSDLRQLRRAVAREEPGQIYVCDCRDRGHDPPSVAIGDIWWSQLRLVVGLVSVSMPAAAPHADRKEDHARDRDEAHDEKERIGHGAQSVAPARTIVRGCDIRASRYD